MNHAESIKSLDAHSQAVVKGKSRPPQSEPGDSQNKPHGQLPGATKPRLALLRRPHAWCASVLGTRGSAHTRTTQRPRGPWRAGRAGPRPKAHRPGKELRCGRLRASARPLSPSAAALPGSTAPVLGAEPSGPRQLPTPVGQPRPASASTLGNNAGQPPGGLSLSKTKRNTARTALGAPTSTAPAPRTPDTVPLNLRPQDRKPPVGRGDGLLSMVVASDRSRPSGRQLGGAKPPTLTASPRTSGGPVHEGRRTSAPTRQSRAPANHRHFCFRHPPPPHARTSGLEPAQKQESFERPRPRDAERGD